MQPIPGMMKVAFTATIQLVFLFDPKANDQRTITATYATAFKAAVEAKKAGLCVVEIHRRTDDQRGLSYTLRPLENDVYEALVGGSVNVPCETPPDRVCATARQFLRECLHDLPEIHLVGRFHAEREAMSVRLDGKRDEVPHQAFFGFDGAYENPTEGWFPGFSYGDEWNGWSKPLFELDVARRVAAMMNPPEKIEDQPFVTFDEARHAFVLTGYGDDPEVIEAEMLVLPGEDESRSVYDFSMGMCWNEEPFDLGKGVGIELTAEDEARDMGGRA